MGDGRIHLRSPSAILAREMRGSLRILERFPGVGVLDSGDPGGLRSGEGVEMRLLSGLNHLVGAIFKNCS